MNTIETRGPSSKDSKRVAQARARAAERLRRQRGTLRPLGLAAMLVVVIGSFSGHPAPGFHSAKALGVTLAVCAFVLALAVAIRDGFTARRIETQTAVIGLMGAAGVALVALQPRGATGLAGAAAVWMALGRLPLKRGLALGGAIAIGLGTAAALAGSSAAATLALLLLCGLLALMAHFMRRAREDQERTEVLLAQLEDAREQQTRAAAIAERGRIASELHDVLAHSLSGAAIQLQGARMLAEREHAGPQMRDAITRAGELVKDGLADAREAVSALRGDELPGVPQLQALVDSFREDMQLEVTFRIDGSVRTLPAEASLALYRGAQEALTNVARYASGASTTVVLRYGSDHTTLSVEDRLPAPSPASRAADGLTGISGGRGLAGMRERVQRVGGAMHAGPTAHGWLVELDVPA